MTINKISPSFEVKKINELIPDILHDLNEDFDFYIAGGMVTSIFTNSEVNDVDVYLKNEEDIFPIVTRLRKCAHLCSATDKSVMFSINEMLINIVLFKTYETPEAIFDSFDFTCVMGSFSMRDNAFYLHEEFMIHNSQRILRFNSKTEFPIMSIIRINKYEKRGFTISKNEMLRMILSASKLNISSYVELEQHIGGMYGLNLAKLIDTKKEFDLPSIIEEFKDIFSKIDESVYDWDVNTERLEARLLSLYFKSFKQLSHFTIKGEYYLVGNGVLLGEVEENVFKNIDRKIGLHQGLVKVYKYVKKQEDKFVSCREAAFEYILGETVVPKNDVGLFCGTLDRRRNFTYSSGSNHVLIELLVEPQSIIKYSSYGNFLDIGSSEITVKKALFKRVIESEETLEQFSDKLKSAPRRRNKKKKKKKFDDFPF